MKKRVSCLLLCMLTAANCMPAYALTQDSNVTFTVGGMKLAEDMSGYNVDGKNYMPLRAFFEMLGGDVDYNEDKKTAKVVLDDMRIIIDTDKMTSELNGEKVDLDLKLFNGRVYLPVRLLGETLGFVVKWDEETGNIDIKKADSDYVLFDTRAYVDEDTRIITFEEAKALHADILLAADAEDRVEVAGLHADGKTLLDVFLAEGAFLEEFLHEGVVILCSLLDEFAAGDLRLVCKSCGNVLLVAVSVGVLVVIILHCEDIHDAVEGSSCVCGELDIDGPAADALLDGSLHIVPVGFFSIELVHCDDEGELVLVCKTEEVVNTNFHALLCVDHENAAFAHLQALVCSADEIVCAGGVDEVDLGVLVLCIKRSSVDGTLVLLLEFIAVGHCVLVFDAAPAVDNFTFEEHCFCECGFAGLCAAQQHHIPDVFG